jgi:hypothetical protein
MCGSTDFAAKNCIIGSLSTVSHKFVSTHRAVAGLLTAPQAAPETYSQRFRRGQETHAEQKNWQIFF